jgi:hypothetical protein
MSNLGGNVKKLSHFFFILSFTSTVFSQPQAPDTVWSIIFGEPSEDDFGTFIRPTFDGGFIITGKGNVPDHDSDIPLIKIDNEGNIQWMRYYGTNEGEVGFCVQQTSDLGFIAVGLISYHINDNKAFIVKTDSLGNLRWMREYPGPYPSSTKGYFVQQTTDGGYIIVGESLQQVYLLKVDANGIEQWSREFGELMTWDIGYCVRQTPDNGYAIVGYSNTFGNGSNDVYLIKTDSLGIEQWYRTFGGLESDWGKTLYITPQGGYIIAGSTYSYGEGSSDFYLIKTDENGNEIWSHTYGDSLYEYVSYAECFHNDGYILVGHIDNPLNAYDNIFLVRTDIEGNEVWNATYQITFSQNAYCVALASDDSYLITGEAWSDYFLLKTEPDAFTGVELVLTIDISGEEAMLNWSSIPFNTNYNIYRGSSPYFNISGMLPYATTADTFFVDDDISEGNYFYKVTFEY